MLKTIVENLFTNFSEEADTWQDAIRLCCEPLMEHGILPKQYAEDVIAQCEKEGPFIIVAPGVAMPQIPMCHNRIDKTSGSFLHLAHPVVFGTGNEAQPVDLLFTLAAANHDEHLILMQRIIGIMENEEIREAIRKAASEADLMKIWDRYKKDETEA